MIFIMPGHFGVYGWLARAVVYHLPTTTQVGSAVKDTVVGLSSLRLTTGTTTRSKESIGQHANGLGRSCQTLC